MSESLHSLAALKRHIASLDRAPAAQPCARFASGHDGLDAALGGGLVRGRVHELFGDGGDAAAAGLSLLWCAKASGDAPLLWLRTSAAGKAGGHPYGPGLAALGIAPDRMLLGVMADEAMLLRAAVDALRCPALGALLIELRGRAPLLDLTASRRLALAAEGTGVTALVLRIDAEPVPSAAETRWRVAAAPSAPLPGNAPGQTSFALTLLRRRAGPDGQAWRLMWDRDRGIFGDAGDERHHEEQRSGDGGAALSGAELPLPADRPAADHAARSVGGRK
jgi:protein ImuA